MIKLRAYSGERDLAHAVSDFLAEHGSAAVDYINDLIPGEGDKVAPINAKLVESYRELSQLINLTMNGQASELAHDLLAKIMLGAWNTGVAATAAPEIRHQFDLLRAENARKARNSKPEEVALLSAINAELKGREVRQPKKEAGSILDAVNARLKAEGHEAVKLDVVRRRLIKMVRS